MNSMQHLWMVWITRLAVTATPNTILTLFTYTTVTWNKAADICSGQGMKFVSFNSVEVNNAVQDFAQEPPWDNQWGDDLWTGLHSYDGLESGLLWHDCTRLDETAYNQWGDKTKLNTEKCIKADVSKKNDWKTDKCNLLRRTLCERYEGTCTFRPVYVGKTVRLTATITTEEIAINGSSTEGDCTDVCLSATHNSLECWGSSYVLSVGTCSLHFATSGTVIENEVVKDTGTNLHVKFCFQAVLDNTDMGQDVYLSELDPVAGCSGPATIPPSTTSTRGTTVTEMEVPSTTSQATDIPTSTEKITTSTFETTHSSRVTTLAVSTLEAASTRGTTFTETEVPTTTIQATDTPTSTEKITTTTSETMHSSRVTTQAVTTLEAASTRGTTFAETEVPTTTIQATDTPTTTEKINTTTSEATDPSLVTNLAVTTLEVASPRTTFIGTGVPVRTTQTTESNASAFETTKLFKSTTPKMITTTTEGTTRKMYTTTDGTTSQLLTSIDGQTSPTMTCTCRCSPSNNLPASENFMKDLLEKLTLNKSKISAIRRKYTSTWDSRWSANGIGIVGMSLVLVVFGIVVAIDIEAIRYSIRERFCQ